MYLEHYGFLEEPFGVCPDPRFFVKTAQHGEAVAALYYAMNQRRGFAALIAPPGLGKTTVITTLLDRLRAQAAVTFLVHPSFDQDTVLDCVLSGFGLQPEPDNAQRRRQLGIFLSNLQAQNRTAIVIVDEAQTVPSEVLETLRMLSNFETTRAKLIQFILVGQPGLGKMLGSPECEQIRQRINLVARLGPLDQGAVADYIARRVQTAAGSRNPFTPAAMDAIAAASAGVPRNVNTICFNALTLGYAGGRKTIGPDDIAVVTADLSLDNTSAPALNPAAIQSTGVIKTTLELAARSGSQPPSPIYAKHNPFGFTFSRRLITLGIC